MKYLGIDFGSKRIGLATSDEKGEFAFPYAVVPHTRELVSVIVEIIKKEQIEEIVCGESKDYQMNDNPIQVQIKAFVENLQATQNIPVHFEPEFMSSHQATHFQGKTAMIDASAATIILQSFLDKQKHLHE